MHYTVGVLLWLRHPAALNLASAQLSKHNATAGAQHLHVLIKLQIWPDKSRTPPTVFEYFVSVLALLLLFFLFVLTLSARWSGSEAYK